MHNSLLNLVQAERCTHGISWHDFSSKKCLKPVRSYTLIWYIFINISDTLSQRTLKKSENISDTSTSMFTKFWNAGDNLWTGYKNAGIFKEKQ